MERGAIEPDVAYIAALRRATAAGCARSDRARRTRRASCRSPRPPAGRVTSTSGESKPPLLVSTFATEQALLRDRARPRRRGGAAAATRGASRSSFRWPALALVVLAGVLPALAPEALRAAARRRPARRPRPRCGEPGDEREFLLARFESHDRDPAREGARARAPGPAGEGARRRSRDGRAHAVAQPADGAALGRPGGARSSRSTRPGARS